MDNLNYVILEGNLTRDPSRYALTAETPLCRFTIAVNRYFKSKSKPGGVEDTSYFNVESWGNIAESCLTYLKKGHGVRVVGRLKQSTWKDPVEGNRPKERVYVIAEHIQFQPKKTDKPHTVIQNDTTSEVQEVLDQCALDEKEENPSDL